MGRDLKDRRRGGSRGISIHAPRMGRDQRPRPDLPYRGNFNPRAPHGARRPTQSDDGRAERFQSTRPAWGATTRRPHGSTRPTNFNPRAPHGARRDVLVVEPADLDISIHAPRMGRDASVSQPSTPTRNFNPRAPHGARLWTAKPLVPVRVFQSTRPAWGATAYNLLCFFAGVISIHAPRMGRDTVGNLNELQTEAFQSTRPAWGATAVICTLVMPFVFQSTRPAWGATSP